jgi:hypothetical protein
MADVVEIARFREYRDRTGEDRFAYEAIAAQLRRALASGHDVQLHVHPSYARATWDGRRWRQHYAEYDFARLSPPRMRDVLGAGRRLLEEVLRAVAPDYTCTVFRAGNWAMQPSRDAIEALIDAGIRIDTSVFKWGRRDAPVRFDYADAWSELVPWPASRADICRVDPASPLFEVPIYAERRWVGAFLTPQRLYRVVQSRLHRLGDGDAGAGRVTVTPGAPRGSRLRRALRLFGRHSWKLDFNQCTGGQLVAALRRAERKASGTAAPIPLVLIGHSKLFTRWNERSLKRLLDFVRRHPDRYGFGTFRDIALQPFQMPAATA